MTVRANEHRQRHASILVLPSAITILALIAGMSAIKFALDGRPEWALALIGAAALLDGVDGRVARLLDAATRIGAELDSLADAINFGVTPALVIYATFLHSSDVDHEAGGWMVVMIYAVCIVLRLARFNALLDDDNRPQWAREYFVGVPAPAAALIVLLPAAIEIGWTDAPVLHPLAVSAWTLFAGALAVSTIPTLALKSISVPPQAAVLLLVGVAVGALILLTYPAALMVVVVFGYLAHIPYAAYTKRWVAARPEVWDTKPAERRAQRRAARRAVPVNTRRTARLRLRRPNVPRIRR